MVPYAYLVISILALVFAMVLKPWVADSLWSRGVSAADVTRDRQRNLGGLENWHVHTIAERIQAMFHLALFSHLFTLSLHLRTINHAASKVIFALTLLGAVIYIFFTVAPMLFRDCPYHTPLSAPIQALITYLARSNSILVRSMRSPVESLAGLFSHSVKKLGQALRHLGARSPLGDTGRFDLNGVEHTWPFAELSTVNWEIYKADVRCISSALGSATGRDMVFDAARFAVDTVLYPEIMGVLSPDTLAGHFLDCLSDWQGIPGRLEHASVIGMVLASVLSIHLCVEPQSVADRRICIKVHHPATLASESEPTFLPGIAILALVSQTLAPENAQDSPFKILSNIPECLPTKQKRCLNRALLQTIWRRRREDPGTLFNLEAIDLFCKRLMANGDHILLALKIDCFLIMTISLGDKVDDNRILYIPDKECVISLLLCRLYSSGSSDSLQAAITLFHKRFTGSISGKSVSKHALALVLSALVHLDPFRAMGTGEFGFLWITRILGSQYQEDERHQLTIQVAQLLAKYFCSGNLGYSLEIEPTWIPPLMDLFSIYESSPLHIPSTSLGSARIRTLVLPTLTSALSPTNTQLRALALKIFHTSMSVWSSPHMENIPSGDLDKLLRAVGDPFLHGALPVHVNRDSMKTVITLIELASSDLWRNHLRSSNFASFEELVSTDNGKRTVLAHISDMVAHTRPEFLCTFSKVTTAVWCLDKLQCGSTVDVVNSWARRTQ